MGQDAVIIADQHAERSSSMQRVQVGSLLHDPVLPGSVTEARAAVAQSEPLGRENATSLALPAHRGSVSARGARQATGRWWCCDRDLLLLGSMRLAEIESAGSRED